MNGQVALRWPDPPHGVTATQTLLDCTPGNALPHCPEFGCELAALEDLAALKLLAVVQRGTKKDFVDVYAICRHGLSLGVMLECYRQKYVVEDIARVVFSLCYTARGLGWHKLV